jgi:hypothetical protein
VKSTKRDKFGRFLAKGRKPRKTVSRPKRDAYGRFIVGTPLECAIDEVVRVEKRQAKAAKAALKKPVKAAFKKPAKVAPKKPGRAAPKKLAKAAPKRTAKAAPKKPVKPAKAAPKKPAKAASKKPAKAAPKKPAKAIPKKPAKAAPKKPAKAAPKKPAKAAPKKPAKDAPKKPAKAAPKKPAKVAPKKPAKVAPKKPAKVAPKKPAKAAPKKPAKIAPKKPAKAAPKKPGSAKKPSRKKKPKKPPERPPIGERSAAAETEIQTRLISLSRMIGVLEPGLSMGIHSFINADGTVDGELRIGNLPNEWRSPRGLTELVATLSNAFSSFRAFDKAPSMGGSFWFSVAVRFGPQNEAEMSELADLYKKNKGLFQIGTYPTRADHLTPLQMCLTDDRRGLRGMIGALAVKRGLPPTAILIRFIWGADWSPERGGLRPGHYKGEKGNQ